jgi:hypothetical protein
MHIQPRPQIQGDTGRKIKKQAVDQFVEPVVYCPTQL